jgi:hypothetical protein
MPTGRTVQAGTSAQTTSKQNCNSQNRQQTNTLQQERQATAAAVLRTPPTAATTAYTAARATTGTTHSTAMHAALHASSRDNAKSTGYQNRQLAHMTTTKNGGLHCVHSALQCSCCCCRHCGMTATHSTLLELCCALMQACMKAPSMQLQESTQTRASAPSACRRATRRSTTNSKPHHQFDRSSCVPCHNMGQRP